MKLRLGTLLVGCLLVVGAGYRLDDAGDWKALSGDWQPTKMEINGQALPVEDVKEFLITMKDGKYSAKRGDEVIDEGKAKIDASKSPKHLELTASVGDAKDKVRLGIYDVKEDTLKFAIASPDKERPTKFESPADSGTIYIEFTRKKK